MKISNWEQRVLFAPDGVEGTATASEAGFEEIATEDEYEYVVEGSEEARNASGADSKSHEEIMAELAEAREKLTALETSAAPVSALQQTMKDFMASSQPVKAPKKDGAVMLSGMNMNRMDDKTFESHINQLMLENPYQAQSEMQARMMEPLLQTVAVNQAQVSREMLFANAASKKIYDRYADEIEEAVAAVPMIDRVRNPKIYQTVLSTVKASHSDELGAESMSEQVEAAVAAALAKYGIDPTKPATTKVTPTGYNAPQSLSGRPSGQSAGKRQVVIPSWVSKEAKVKGLDAGFLYEHYKDSGRVK